VASPARLPRRQTAALLAAVLAVPLFADQARAADTPDERAAPAELRAASPAAVSAENERKLHQAFEHLYSLEFSAALATFEEVARAEPQSATVRAFWTSALLYKILALQGSLQSQLFVTTNDFLRFPRTPPDPELDKKFWEVTAETRKLAQQRLAQNPQDADGLFAMGLSFGNEANYQAGVRAEYLKGLRAGEKAYDLYVRFNKLHPEIHDAGVVLGVHDYVIGSLPGHLRFLLFFLGSKGNRQKGLDYLKEAATGGEFLRTYSEVLLVVASIREKQLERALGLVQELRARYPRNPVFRLEQAKLLRRLERYREAEETARALFADLTANPHNPRILGPEDALFELGLIQEAQGQLDHAAETLAQVPAVPEANKRVQALAWLERGKIYDRLGQRQHAMAEYDKVVRLDADVQITRLAHSYRKKPYVNHPEEND
jgi:tetratricopeptide (TPR) repeat protein